MKAGPFRVRDFRSVSGPSGRTAGSVLMEAVVCLPVLLLLVTGIWQFCRIWEARFFTWLAAYNAARAALVYNPRDYAWRLASGNAKQVVDDEAMECRVEDENKWVFHEKRGVVWLAAVNTLAWISQTEGDEADWYPFPRFKSIPYSARIKEQVRVVSALDPGIVAANASGKRDWRFSEETNGVVRVCVEFKLPLLLSIFDPASIWPREAGAESPLKAFSGVEEDDAGTRGKALGRTFSLRETVALPKPWNTDRYPLVSMAERAYLTDAERGLSNLSGLWPDVD